MCNHQECWTVGLVEYCCRGDDAPLTIGRSIGRPVLNVKPFTPCKVEMKDSNSPQIIAVLALKPLPQTDKQSLVKKINYRVGKRAGFKRHRGNSGEVWIISWSVIKGGGKYAACYAYYSQDKQNFLWDELDGFFTVSFIMSSWRRFYDVIVLMPLQNKAVIIVTSTGLLQ